MSTTTELKRELLDDDGENQAIRCFLMLYGTTSNVTLRDMCRHLPSSGFDGCWPDWMNQDERSHLTKGGAQDWLRHLFALEGRTAAHGEPSEAIDASEREFITKRLRRVAKLEA